MPKRPSCQRMSARQWRLVTVICCWLKLTRRPLRAVPRSVTQAQQLGTPQQARALRHPLSSVPCHWQLAQALRLLRVP